MIKLDLKTIMNKKDVNISQLNEMTGISRNSLSLLINGKSKGIQFDTIDKISKALNAKIEDLFIKSFDNISIEIDRKERIKGHFPTMTFKEVHNPLNKKIEILNEDDYTHVSFSVLNCNIIEDNVMKSGYIPYKILLDLTGSNYLEIIVNIEKSQLSNELTRLLNVTINEKDFRNIFHKFFINKILDFERKNLIELLKVHKSFTNKVRIDFFIEETNEPTKFDNTSFSNINKNLYPDKEDNIKESLEKLNKNNSGYLYQLNEELKITKIK